MNKINLKRLYIVLLAYAVWLIYPLPAASNEKFALNAYQQAESAYEDGRYEQAIALYNKAISYRGFDGKITTKEQIETFFRPRGRTIEKNEILTKTTKPYYPNQRIKELREIILEQQRSVHPPHLQLKWVSMDDPSGNNVFDGGETSSIVVEVENIGKSDALNVKLVATMTNMNGLTFNNLTDIGVVPAGKSIIKKIVIDVDRNVPELNRQLDIRAIEKSGFNSNSLEVFVQSKPHQSEKIIITNLRIEELSGDSLIEPTEMVMLKASIRNIGEGVSPSMIAKLDLGDNVFVPPEQTNIQKLGKIYPGENFDIEFSFFTNRKFINKQRIPVLLHIMDENNNKIALSNPGLTMFVPNKSVTVRVLPRKPNINNLNNNQLVDVDVNIPNGLVKNPNAVAIIIGNRNYAKKGLPRVEYAHNDARIMKQYLIKTLGYDENNVLYYEDATNGNFVEIFGTEKSPRGRLSNLLKNADSELFVYYSGHGAPDLSTKNSFFVPVDADPNYIALSGYPLDLFYNNIAQLDAKNITIVLDTCFSGNSDGGFLLNGISPVKLNTKRIIPKLKNATIYTSTRIDQVSVWFHEKKHSLFTYYFLKGLGGAADNNKNSIITSTELANYISDSVPYQARRLNGFEQNPSLLQTTEKQIVKLPKNVLQSVQFANSL